MSAFKPAKDSAALERHSVRTKPAAQAKWL